MSRFGEWLSGPHKSIDVRADGGRRYRVVARRKGIAEVESPAAAIFMPSVLWVPWTIFRWLRWNLVYRRAWLVEVFVHDTPRSVRLEHLTEALSRQRALELAAAQADALRGGKEPRGSE